mmetsp:Transcript_43941/g.109577  ORF Transcript_43941/g.109577 Transcript_43941/m.109577 type:complete len:363 (-) Transcript_43941:296-1384(-)
MLAVAVLSRLRNLPSLELASNVTMCLIRILLVPPVVPSSGASSSPPSTTSGTSTISPPISIELLSSRSSSSSSSSMAAMALKLCWDANALRMALGLATDWARGVSPGPTPISVVSMPPLCCFSFSVSRAFATACSAECVSSVIKRIWRRLNSPRRFWLCVRIWFTKAKALTLWFSRSRRSSSVFLTQSKYLSRISLTSFSSFSICASFAAMVLAVSLADASSCKRRELSSSAFTSSSPLYLSALVAKACSCLSWFRRSSTAFLFERSSGITTTGMSPFRPVMLLFAPLPPGAGDTEIDGVLPLAAAALALALAGTLLPLPAAVEGGGGVRERRGASSSSDSSRSSWGISISLGVEGIRPNAD